MADSDTGKGSGPLAGGVAGPMSAGVGGNSHRPAGAGGGGYREKYSVYAAKYGKSLRSVKLWVSDGRKAGDPPPLDEPGKMAAWWQRNMVNKVPDGILKHSAGEAPLLELPIQRKEEPLAKVVGVKRQGKEPDEEAEEVDLAVLEEEMGLEQTLVRLERLEVQLSRNAHKAGQTAAWLNTVARMGTVAQKLREENERQGKLLPRTLVEDAIHAFHGPIEREFRLMYRTMCEVMGLPASPEREAAWNGECDELFKRFGEKVLA